MNCQRARDTFTELLDRRTAATAHLDARTHLAGCPDCQREFAGLSTTLAALDTLPVPTPSPRLRRDFYARLEEEKNSAASVRVASARRPRTGAPGLLRWILAPLAGTALAAVAFVAGQRSGREPAAPAPVAPTTIDARTQARIAELERKLDTMGQLVVATSLLQQQQKPANDRLRTVLTSASSPRPSESAINELIGTLALDPSVNVRLRALDGLFPHADQEVVRAGVLASLTREQNPIVQVSMIDFLAGARDAEAKPTLETIAANAAADASVRDAARRALTLF
jgi:hypothetical protein